MFQIVSNGSDKLKAIISIISTIVEEATFSANKTGISFRGMDPSHVAMIDVDLPALSFSKYECSEDLKFGVRLGEISKLIKRADKSDDVEITISKDNLLIIKIGNNKQYKIRLIESESADTPLPKLNYDSDTEITYKEFEKTLGDVQVMSNFVTVNTYTDKVILSGVGDSGNVEITIPQDQCKINNQKEKATGTFALEYLLPVIKSLSNVVDKVIYSLMTDKPIKMTFSIDKFGTVIFYMAPRVE